MKEYSLHYGGKKLTFSVPEKHVQQIIQLGGQRATAPNSGRIEEKMKVFLRNFPRQRYFDGRNVCCIVPDGTRDIPLQELIQVVKPLLLNTRQLLFIIATGSHDPFLQKTVSIREWLLVEFHEVPSVDVKIHDAFHDGFLYLGYTRRETPIYINRAVLGYDTYLLLGDMKPHYFAGYSNPLKLLVPGIAAFPTIEANHAMALDLNNHACLHPLHPVPDRQGNALMADILEINDLFWKNKHVFTAAIVSSHGRILDFEIGPWKETIGKMLPVVDHFMSQEVKAADLTILSCGGEPLDESLYNAQRALELCMASFKEGGKVIFLARCENGLGPQKAKKNFYDLMLMPMEELEQKLMEKYILYSHKSLRFLKLLKKLDRLYMVTQLEEKWLKSLGIEKIQPSHFQHSLNLILKEMPDDFTINIIDDGAKLALFRSHS